MLKKMLPTWLTIVISACIISVTWESENHPTVVTINTKDNETDGESRTNRTGSDITETNFHTDNEVSTKFKSTKLNQFSKRQQKCFFVYQSMLRSLVYNQNGDSHRTFSDSDLMKEALKLASFKKRKHDKKNKNMNQDSWPSHSTCKDVLYLSSFLNFIKLYTTVTLKRTKSLSYKSDKNSELRGRKKRSNTKIAEEIKPRILNRNTNIFAREQEKLQNPLQFFQDSTFSHRDSQVPYEDQTSGFVPSKFIPSKPISFEPNFQKLEEPSKPITFHDPSSNKLLNTLEFKVNNVDLSRQFLEPPVMEFEANNHEKIEQTIDTYRLENNIINPEAKFSREELDQQIQSTPERYMFWPRDIPTYDVSEAPLQVPPYINFEDLEYSQESFDDINTQYLNYDVAEDRISIDIEGDLEYVDSFSSTAVSKEDDGNPLIEEVQDNVFVIPVYKENLYTEIPEIADYNKQPIILTPQVDTWTETSDATLSPATEAKEPTSKTELENVEIEKLSTIGTPIGIETFFDQLAEATNIQENITKEEKHKRPNSIVVQNETEISSDHRNPKFTVPLPIDGVTLGVVTHDNAEHDSVKLIINKNTAAAKVENMSVVTLPHNNLPSPHNNLPSPPNNLTSPPNNLTSPPNNLTSPPNNLPSPPNNLTSPYNNLTSHHNILISPHNNLTATPNNLNNYKADKLSNDTLIQHTASFSSDSFQTNLKEKIVNPSKISVNINEEATNNITAVTYLVQSDELQHNDVNENLELYQNETSVTKMDEKDHSPVKHFASTTQGPSEENRVEIQTMIDVNEIKSGIDNSSSKKQVFKIVEDEPAKSNVKNNNHTSETLTFQIPTTLDNQNLGSNDGENITEVFLGTKDLQLNAPNLTVDKHEKYVHNNTNNNAINHDVHQDDIELETISESMSLNATSNTTISQSYLNTMVNLTKIEDLEKEEIFNTIQNLVEETTMYTLSDDPTVTVKMDEIVDNNDIETDTTEDSTDQEATTRFSIEEFTTRRLPEKLPEYMRTRSRPTITTRPPPKIINHNMNLQTALIINTLSKVLPNVPQSRLKNQPRLENVGTGVIFHQEEIFIFHTTLTELQAILDKSLRRGGLPSDLMVSIYAAKEHNLALVHLFYRLLLRAEFSSAKSVKISQEDSRTFAKHFHFLRAIFPFL